MPPRKRPAAAAAYKEDGFVVEDDEPETKRVKPTKSATQKETGKQFKDDEGNAYWEVCGMPLLPDFDLL